MWMLILLFVLSVVVIAASLAVDLLLYPEEWDELEDE